MIDTEIPVSFLTKEAIQALIGSNSTVIQDFNVTVNGKIATMQLSRDHFEYVNIIGMDFLKPLKSLKYNLIESNKNI